jgi:serine/threonine-protein kinase RsbW
MKKIEIPSSIENLTIIEKLVDELAESIKFDSELYANILVCVTEAVKNSIIHGNNSEISKVVTIEYSYSEHQVCFVISDMGTGFNHYQVADPTLPDNIEKETGRGIFLMNCLADQVIYNDKGNEVSLKFYYKIG